MSYHGKHILKRVAGNPQDDIAVAEIVFNGDSGVVSVGRSGKSGLENMLGETTHQTMKNKTIDETNEVKDVPPIGSIMLFPKDAILSSSLSKKWLECNGQIANSTYYPDLVAFLGKIYGQLGKLPYLKFDEDKKINYFIKAKK